MIRNFKGITVVKTAGDRTRWRAQISYASKTWPLGDYDTEEAAAVAFDRAQVCKAGYDGAQTNFPKENYVHEADKLQRMSMEQILVMLRQERQMAKAGRSSAAGGSPSYGNTEPSWNGSQGVDAAPQGPSQIKPFQSRSSSPNAGGSKKRRLQDAGTGPDAKRQDTGQDAAWGSSGGAQGARPCLSRPGMAGGSLGPGTAPMWVASGDGSGEGLAMAAATSGQRAALAVAEQAISDVRTWLETRYSIRELDSGWRVMVSLRQGEGGQAQGEEPALVPVVAFVSPQGVRCEDRWQVAAALGLPMPPEEADEQQAGQPMEQDQDPTHSPGGKENAGGLAERPGSAVDGPTPALQPTKAPGAAMQYGLIAAVADVYQPAADSAAAAEAAQMLTLLAAREERVEEVLACLPAVPMGSLPSLGTSLAGLSQRLATAGAFDGLLAAHKQASRTANGDPTSTNPATSRQPGVQLALVTSQMQALLSAAEAEYKKLKGKDHTPAPSGLIPEAAGGPQLAADLKSVRSALAVERNMHAIPAEAAEKVVNGAARLVTENGPGSLTLVMPFPRAVPVPAAPSRKKGANWDAGIQPLAQVQAPAPAQVSHRGGRSNGQPGSAMSAGQRSNVPTAPPAVDPIATLAAAANAAELLAAAAAPPELRFTCTHARAPRVRSSTAHTTMTAFVQFAAGEPVPDATAQLLLVLLSLPQSPQLRRQLPSPAQVAEFQAAISARPPAAVPHPHAALPHAVAGHHNPSAHAAAPAQAAPSRAPPAASAPGGVALPRGPPLATMPPGRAPSGHGPVLEAAAPRPGPAPVAQPGPPQPSSAPPPMQPQFMGGPPPGMAVLPPGVQLMQLPDGRQVYMSPSGPPGAPHMVMQQGPGVPMMAAVPGPMGRGPQGGPLPQGGPPPMMSSGLPPGTMLMQNPQGAMVLVQAPPGGPQGGQQLVQVGGPGRQQLMAMPGGGVMLQGGPPPPGPHAMQMPQGGRPGGLAAPQQQQPQIKPDSQQQQGRPGPPGRPAPSQQEPEPQPTLRTQQPVQQQQQQPRQQPQLNQQQQQQQQQQHQHQQQHQQQQQQHQAMQQQAMYQQQVHEAQQRQLQSMVASGQVPPGASVRFNPDGSMTVFMPNTTPQQAQQQQQQMQQAQQQQQMHQQAAMQQQQMQMQPPQQPQQNTMLVQTPHGLMRVLVPEEMEQQHAGGPVPPEGMKRSGSQQQQQQQQQPTGMPGGGQQQVAGRPGVKQEPQGPRPGDANGRPLQQGPPPAQQQQRAGGPGPGFSLQQGPQGQLMLHMAGGQGQQLQRPPAAQGNMPRAGPDSNQQQQQSGNRGTLPPPKSGSAPGPKPTQGTGPQGPGGQQGMMMMMQGGPDGSGGGGPGGAGLKVVNGMLLVDSSTLGGPGGPGGAMAPGGPQPMQGQQQQQQPMYMMQRMPGGPQAPGGMQPQQQQQVVMANGQKMLVGMPPGMQGGHMVMGPGGQMMMMMGAPPPGMVMAGPPRPGQSQQQQQQPMMMQQQQQQQQQPRGPGQQGPR